MITWDMVKEERVAEGIKWTTGTQWMIMPKIFTKKYDTDADFKSRRQTVVLNFFNRKEKAHG